MEGDGVSDLVRRKVEHIDLVLAGVGRGAISAGFEHLQFEHSALPDLDFDAVDLTTHFLGRPLRAPLIISSMTGGPSRSGMINDRLAQAAQALGIGFAVGSQRVALEAGAEGGLDRRLRRLAPDVPILANVGAAQFVSAWSVEHAQRALDAIDADALIIHLNPLQEVIQKGGDRDWRGVSRRIASVCRALARPIIVKEVGFGLSGSVVTELIEAGVAGVDVAGAGGTNWALIEGGRGGEGVAQVANAFAGWGIPTVEAIAAARSAAPNGLIIGSGGVHDGVDAAKAIRVGADIVGQAAGVLQAATQSTEAVITHFEVLIAQLRAACFCTGSADLAALSRARLLPRATGGGGCRD